MAKDKKIEFLNRAYYVFAIVAFAAVLIFANAAKISIYEGDKWRSRADSLFIKEAPAMSERGNILAEDGTILATSVPFFDIYMDINADALDDETFNKNIDSLSIMLAKFVFTDKTSGFVKDMLTKARTSNNRFLLIEKKVNFHDLRKIKKFPIFRLGRNKGGFIVQPYEERMRPYKGLASRTLGYINEDVKVGLEGYYNKYLAGEEGKQLMQKVGNNEWMPLEDLTEIEPQKGSDLITTIDIDIQDFAHRSLYDALKHHNADHGTVIVMDVKTGAIKAISNLGRKDGDWIENYNYGVGMATEPGSTFKLVSMIALLEDGFVKLTDTVNVNFGQTKYGGVTLKDAHTLPYKATTVQHAFEISSNVGISTLVNQYYGVTNKADVFIKRIEDLGLNKPTGIDLDGEAIPYIRKAYDENKGWSHTSLPWMSIGYETMVTPLQMLNLYNAIANNGKLMKPYLLDRVEKDGLIVKRFPPKVLKDKIVSTENLKYLHTLLEGVVTNGTAKNLETKQYTFAGKTGTAQQNYHKLKSTSGIKYQASFVGYFPAENPVYSCIVVITNPKDNGIYGGYVAGPVFRSIMDRIFTSKPLFYNVFNVGTKEKLKSNQLPTKTVGFKNDIEKLLAYLNIDYDDKTDKNKSMITALVANSDTLEMVQRNINKEIMPNLIGLGAKDAVYILENMGIQVQLSGTGKVKYQSVDQGSKISKQIVRLILE
ncbi:MAG: transpeptidase family protein [Saprospiraceae bacterium]|nr:transpeptidase family protein [Saprospiraceae bacterium]